MVEFTEEGEADPVAAQPAARRGPPWHLWAVGLLSLLWNLIGVADYTLSQLGNRAWLKGGADQMGTTVENMIAYIESFPAWAHAFWALGVWGAVFGSILLLLRNRLAVWAFAISLLGLAVTQFYRAFAPQPEWAQGDLVFNLILWSIATFLLIYAVSMRNKGVIR
jgi:hypothetical protein